MERESKDFGLEFKGSEDNLLFEEVPRLHRKERRHARLWSQHDPLLAIKCLIGTLATCTWHSSFYLQIKTCSSSFSLQIKTSPTCLSFPCSAATKQTGQSVKYYVITVFWESKKCLIEKGKDYQDNIKHISQKVHGSHQILCVKYISSPFWTHKELGVERNRNQETGSFQ